MTSTCTGACGLMSWKASVHWSSYTLLLGISPRRTRAKMLLSSYGGRPFTIAGLPRPWTCARPRGLGSGDLGGIQADSDRQVSSARRLLGDAADALAALQLVPDLLGPNAARHPEHDQVVEHVGTFCHHLIAIAGHRL